MLTEKRPNKQNATYYGLTRLYCLATIRNAYIEALASFKAAEVIKKKVNVLFNTKQLPPFASDCVLHFKLHIDGNRTCVYACSLHIFHKPRTLGLIPGGRIAPAALINLLHIFL